MTCVPSALRRKCNATGCEFSSSKFTTSEKPLTWSWLCDADIQNILVYKSYTVVKEFWAHNIVLCEQPRENKPLLI